MRCSIFPGADKVVNHKFMLLHEVSVSPIYISVLQVPYLAFRLVSLLSNTVNIESASPSALTPNNIICS